MAACIATVNRRPQIELLSDQAARARTACPCPQPRLGFQHLPVLPPLQLIDARTVAAADSALAGLAGGVGQIVQAMRTECLDLLVEMDVR